MLQKYLITSPDFYTHSPEKFQKILQRSFKKHQPQYALYRDKTAPDYEAQAKIFLQVAKEFPNMKTFLHGDYTLAATLGANGVHLTSQQFDTIEKAKALDLEVIISTHTLEEVDKAQKLGASYVSYSPIFFTPNKGVPKGIENLQEVLAQTDIKIFALGGIVDEQQVALIAQTSVYGFSSIRYFYT